LNELLIKKISEIIIESAKTHKLVEYNMISNKLNGAIPPNRLNDPLGEISYRCIKNGFPPLSAIVINQSTNRPGEGFFTWVASKMGYSDLSDCESFFQQQKNAVFNFKDWDLFLEKEFGDTREAYSFESLTDINKLLNLKEYMFGKETNYYILTVKEFKETQQIGPFRYQVLLLEKNQIIEKSIIEDNVSKQLLTPAKIKGIQLLFAKVSNISSENVTMVHFKPDRNNSKKLWEKETEKSLKILMIEERLKVLNNVITKDLDAENSQEDSYFMEGKSVKYYGTRYERNPNNRAKAIQIHGLKCKTCKFDFEKTYGERGKDFIEIHHINPLFSIGNEMEIKPETDLVPVCSNCHRMIHRQKNNILSISELKDLILRNETLE